MTSSHRGAARGEGVWSVCPDARLSWPRYSALWRGTRPPTTASTPPGSGTCTNPFTGPTAGGKPRMDLVNFTYHHALAPLISDETLEMELRIHKRQMEIFWTTTPATSRGYFPAETCFTARMIPILNKVGIEWSIIANTHLARACPDVPILTGSGGEMCDLPNRADQLNPAQGAGNYRRLQIDRGCSPVQVMPFGFQLHYARYVDPETGAESKLIVVPSDQVLGWKDSYSQWDLNLLNALATRNDTSK